MSNHTCGAAYERDELRSRVAALEEENKRLREDILTLEDTIESLQDELAEAAD